jgi:hypothetical protein
VGLRLPGAAIYLHVEPEHLRWVVQGEPAPPVNGTVAKLAEALAVLSPEQQAALVEALSR